MPESPIRVGLAGDDHAHRLLIERLADAAAGPERVARRAFVGDGAGESLLRAGKRPERRAAPSGRPQWRSQRHEGAPGGQAQVFVELVQILAERGVQVALVLVDEDGDPERHAAARRAAEILARRGAVPAVLGVCEPCGEGWLVALIGPTREERLRALAKELTFRPEREPHRLCSKPADAPRHAKRVLHFVLDDAHDTLGRYPSSTPRGEEVEAALTGLAVDRAGLARLDACGIAAFMGELDRVYVPMLGRSPA